MFRRMWLTATVSGLAALSALSVSGCNYMANRPTARPAGEIDVSLRRGVSWTTFVLKRGRLTGSTGSLEFKKGQISGFLDGRAVRLTAKPDELSGVAGGQVQLDIEEYDGKIDISGTWNGDRVHVEVTPESLKGTVTGNALGHCQYVLDRKLADGVLSGQSICSGMPEETRLEFPREIEHYLVRGEAVVVLLAVLSSAPPTSTDGMFGPVPSDFPMR